jgi:hypothetical protein
MQPPMAPPPQAQPPMPPQGVPNGNIWSRTKKHSRSTTQAFGTGRTH